MTQGDDIQNAYEMAVDALGLAITSLKAENQEIPHPTDPWKITINPDEFCVVKDPYHT